jgi:uncharacterized protein YbcI
MEAEVATRLARALSGILRERSGRGPERTRVYECDEHVVVVFEGGLTQIERTLLEGGDSRLVQQVRIRFDELGGGQALRDEVERTLGRQVVDFHSQMLIPSERFVQVFVMAGKDGSSMSR